MNSGIVAMPRSVDPRSMTSNMTAIPGRRPMDLPIMIKPANMQRVWAACA
jgi:hypothetical protein